MKRLVVIVLVLCFVCLFLAGCAPQATEEEIQAVDEATAVMADSRFDVGAMTDVPISLLGVSEDAIQKSALYTKSTEGVAGVDAEYKIELDQGKEIKVQINDGRVSNVWITISGSASIDGIEISATIEDFFDNIVEINNQYTLESMVVGNEDVSADSWVASFASGDGQHCALTWDDDEVPGFFAMAQGNYDASIEFIYISYVFSVV